MLENIVQYFIFPLIGGVAAVMVALYSEDEKLRFTIRGFIVLFFLGAIVGGGLYAICAHLFWGCDATHCGYGWVN